MRSTRPFEDYRGNDRFEIIRRIGAGGMGVVYEALDRERRLRVALKTLPQIHPQALYLFKNEFRALAGVTHPNLVTLYELLNEGEHWFFTMEFVEGVDFLRFVAPNSKFQGASAETTTLAMETAPDRRRRRFFPLVDYAALRGSLAQVVTGLAALHAEGKVHRDVKPSNVLVTAEGRAVILDFGLVQDISADSKRTGTGAGSAAYMSPEQAAGEPLDPATDWYSTGAMLYEALTGELPRRWEAVSLEMLAPAAPRELKNLCEALLERDRRKRPGAREILSMLDQSAPRSVQEPAERTVFVGRVQELRKLDEAFRQMRRGEGVVVSIEGASGLGKSALLRECAERFRAVNAAVLEGRCYEQESVPYKAIDSLIDRLTSYLRRLPEIEVPALMPRDAGLLPDLFPVLGGLPEVASARVRGNIEPQETRRRAFQAIRELFSRLGDRVPLVLIIDDLQWGDQDSANLLAEVLRQPDGPALLLIVAYRAGYGGRSKSFDAVLAALENQKVARIHIELSPFASQETHELANLLLPSASAADAALIETIVRETHGNAFFIRELLHTAREEGIQRSVSLESTILARVLALPVGPAALLETVSVAARPILQSVAYRAAGAEGSDPGMMAFLRSVRFVRTSGNTLVDDVEPYHDRVRETVVGSLSGEQLRARHGALAQALEESGGEPESVAIHLERSGQTLRAVGFYQRAGENARNSLAFERAASLFAQALALIGPADPRCPTLLEALADAQANAGFSLAGAQTYRSLIGLPGMEARNDLARKSAYQFCICGHAQEGMEAFRVVLKRVGLRMPLRPWHSVAGRIALLTWIRARGLRFRPRPAAQIPAAKLEAIDVCHFLSLSIGPISPYSGMYFSALAVVLALVSGEPERAVKALAWEAVVTGAFPASLKRAEQLLKRAREISETQDTPINPRQAHARPFMEMARGMVLFESGLFAEALQSLQVAESALAETTGMHFELNATRTYWLWTLITLGRAGELAATSPMWFQDALNRGDAYTAANVGAYPYVLGLLGQDDPERASAIHTQSMAIWPAQHYTLQKMMAALGRGWIDLYIDDAEAAWHAANEHWKRARRVFLHLLENVAAYMLQWRGLSALAMAERMRENGGNAEEFIRAADRDAASLRKLKLAHGPAMGAAILAGTAAIRRDRTATIEHLKSAVQQFDKLSMAMLAAILERELGRITGEPAVQGSAEEKLSALGVRNFAGVTRLFGRGVRTL